MQSLESMTSFKQEASQVIFEFGASRLAVSVQEAGLVRIRYAFKGEFLPRRSWAVAKEDTGFSGFKVKEEIDAVEITTEQLKVRVRRADGGVEFLSLDGQMLSQDDQSPLFNEHGLLYAIKTLPSDEYFYGFGERTSLLNKRGFRYTCWTFDPVEKNMDHGPGTDNLYQAIPFFMALRPNVGGYGLFFNNTYETVFDVGYSAAKLLAMEAKGGELDYYFIYGPSPAQIVGRYTDLTGRSPLPPRWSLGYHQSRWSYFPESRVREIADGLRENQIPADVIHLDIDYMEGYRVFTWNNSRFSDPRLLCDDLAAQGFKVVTIIDPGVKYEPGGNFGVFNEGVFHDYFIRQPNGEEFQGYVWPGASVFPDFTRPEVREWWGEQHRILLAAGVAGIWNDMNEPAISEKPFGQISGQLLIPSDSTQGSEAEPTTHGETHNVYGLLENQATYNGLVKLHPQQRPFILTRAGYAGIQRWAAVWTGDNSASWEHLEMAMPQLCNLGLSGVSFAGTDIGGFWGASSPELWARWIQLGAFYPFARGHSAIGTPNKEPWAWNETVTSIARKYLGLRYRLLPYLYNLFEENSRTGAPVWRPLLYHFWQDPQVLQLHDQVMVGESLMLAPIYRAGYEQRAVYFPAGLWYAFEGQAVKEKRILAHAPLEHMPIYVRGGAILPIGPVMQHTGERVLDELTLAIYPDEKGMASGRLYEDDGQSFAYQDGESCLTVYSFSSTEDGKARLVARRHGDFKPAARTVEVKVYGGDEVRIVRLESDEWEWEVVI